MASGDAGEQRRIESSLIFEIGGAGHQHVVVVLAPFDRKLAAGQRDLYIAIGTLQPGGGDRDRNGGRPAGPGQADATLPGADSPAAIAVDDMGERDVGALRKDRTVFQQRPESARLYMGVDVLDQKIAWGLPIETTDGECSTGASMGPTCSSM